MDKRENQQEPGKEKSKTRTDIDTDKYTHTRRENKIERERENRGREREMRKRLEKNSSFTCSSCLLPIANTQLLSVVMVFDAVDNTVHHIVKVVCQRRFFALQ